MSDQENEEKKEKKVNEYEPVTYDFSHVYDETEYALGEINNISHRITESSGVAREGYNNLMGTFTPQQRSIADQYNIQANLNTVFTNTELIQQQNELIKKQTELMVKRDIEREKEIEDARNEAKKQRDRFYITTGLAIIAIIITIIALIAS